MGFYFAGPGGYGPLIFACQQCQPDLVVIGNEYKAVHDVKAVSRNTQIVYRVTGHDFEIDPAKAHDLLPRLRAEAPDADYYSIANEIVPQDGAQAVQAVCGGYIGAIHVAADMGLKITVGNINTGFPVLSEENLDAMTPMLSEAARLRMPLAVHYYNHGDPHGDPSAVIWKALADRAPGIKVIIEEYGILNNQMVSGEMFDTFLSYDEMLDDRVIGVAVFALCSPSWATCDYTDQLPRLIDHVKTWR